MTALHLFSMAEAIAPTEADARQVLDEALWSVHQPGRRCIICLKPLHQQISYLALLQTDDPILLSGGVCADCSMQPRGEIEKNVAQITVLHFCTTGTA
jgi:hypothetical protein